MFLASTASSQDLTLIESDRGWVDGGGGHIPSNINYLTGRDEDGFDYRSFFIFDLASLPSGAVVSTAELRINTAMVVDGPVTIEVRQYTADLALLNTADPGVATFEALGTGPILGSFVVTTSDILQDVSLGEAARSALAAAASGSFAFALRSTVEGSGLSGAFSFSHVSGANSLVLSYVLAPPLEPSGGGSGAAAAPASARAAANRQMQAQQAAARRIATQQRLAQHRRNQQR